MLTDTELSSMRATALDCLPGTAVVESQTFVSDGGGAGSLSWSASGTLACRIAPLTGTERETADRVAPYADYVITLPFDAAVDTGSRLLIDGDAYNVEAIRDRSWQTTMRVEATRES